MSHHLFEGKAVAYVVECLGTFLASRVVQILGRWVKRSSDRFARLLLYLLASLAVRYVLFRDIRPPDQWKQATCIGVRSACVGLHMKTGQVNDIMCLYVVKDANQPAGTPTADRSD
jgi:hypothetical protein